VNEPYTHGIWQVKQGRGEEFVAAWEEFAAWSMQQARGISWGVLLRDHADGQRFIGVGAWESADDIAFWRWDPGFEERFERLKALVDHYEFGTMELAAVRDPRE
jgi:quinol monooxygenase YgiN